MAKLNDQNLSDLQTVIEKREKARTAKHKKMKVSGKNVIALKNIIIKKSQ